MPAAITLSSNWDLAVIATYEDTRAAHSPRIYNYLGACDSSDQMATTKGQTAPPTGDEISSDIPILPVAESDSWEYEVCIQIPAGVTSPGSEEVQRKYARIRTYLGKISAVEGLPKVD